MAANKAKARSTDCTRRGPSGGDSIMQDCTKLVRHGSPLNSRHWGVVRGRSGCRFSQRQHEPIGPVEERGALDGVMDLEVIQPRIPECHDMPWAERGWSLRERYGRVDDGSPTPTTLTGRPR